MLAIPASNEGIIWPDNLAGQVLTMVEIRSL